MRTHSTARTAGAILFLLATLSLTAERGLGQPCVGDCNGNGEVHINELLLAMNIALESQAFSACPALDPNGDAAVTVDEIVASVFNALNGCDGAVGGSPRASSALITITSTTAEPGQVVPVSAQLDTAGEQIVATQNDIVFGGQPGGIAAKANGRPDCAANAAINKTGTSFAFLPSGCSPGTDCESVRAIVIALDNLNPIPDGAVLYTCNVEITLDAGIGETIFLFVDQPLASDSDANALFIGGVDGMVEIGGEPTSTPTPTGVGPAGTPTPTATVDGASTATPTAPGSPGTTSTPTTTRTGFPGTPTQPPVLSCVGDCSGDRGVDIAELITGVGIALGNQAPSACPAFDADGSGAVDIGELVTAVNNALRGCL